MLYKLKQGRHYAWPFTFRLWFGKKIYNWKVCFQSDCRYELPGDDQGDTNKLCGVGFLPGHHKDSIRCGWWYDPGRKQIAVNVYAYVNGVRIIQHIGYCYMNTTYGVQIIFDRTAKAYTLVIWETTPDGKEYIQRVGIANIEAKHKKRFAYSLGVYFGGNRTAPHTMYVGLNYIKK